MADERTEKQKVQEISDKMRGFFLLSRPGSQTFLYVTVLGKLFTMKVLTGHYQNKT